MSGLVMYTCPLGPYRWAHLYLPSDLVLADVRRIVAMLQTLPPDPVIGYHADQSLSETSGSSQSEAQKKSDTDASDTGCSE